MSVNDGPWISGHTPGTIVGLELSGPLTVGGAPKRAGLVGCISQLVVQEKALDVLGDAYEKVGLLSCREIYS